MIGAETRVETDVDAADAIDEAVRDALMDAATAGFNRSQEVVAAEATDTGQLLRSGAPPAPRADGSVVWGYAASYAPFVDKGTRPHMPPVDALRGWARRVLGDEDLAWPVALSIKREGTEPVNFIRDGIDATKAWFDAHGISGKISEKL